MTCLSEHHSSHVIAAHVFLAGDTMFQLPLLLLLVVTPLRQLTQPGLEARNKSPVAVLWRLQALVDRPPDAPGCPG